MYELFGGFKDKLKVRCMNKACMKVIDEREKQIHLNIYHPNYISLARTLNLYDDLDRYKTPKQIVKLLFTEIKIKNGYSERINEI